jgi:hypothetical protein
MRFVNGMLAAAGTLVTLGMGMGVVNFSVRSFAGRRLAERGDDLTSEALLLMY